MAALCVQRKKDNGDEVRSEESMLRPLKLGGGGVVIRRSRCVSPGFISRQGKWVFITLKPRPNLTWSYIKSVINFNPMKLPDNACIHGEMLTQDHFALCMNMALCYKPEGRG
jgi:hypothetical protein